MATIPTLKVNMIPTFPAVVKGTSGIGVAVANGIYTLALDYTGLVPVGSVSDADKPDSFFAFYNSNLSQFQSVSLSNLAAQLTLTAALAAISVLTPAADNVPYYTGSATAALTSLTSYGRSLIGAANAAATLTLLGTIPAASGGTGQTSYAVGDLLYASGATALSKLADVATGNVLLSGGVATAPAWGKVDLTAHVTGVLPIANGGHGTATTTANLVFAGPTSGGAAAPSFRSLVGADFPAPTSSTFGGIKSLAAVSHNFLTSIGTDGIPVAAQPAFTDISGSVAATQMPALTGDVTTSAGAVATTVGKVNGVAYSAAPATNTVPVVTSSNTITYEQVPLTAGGTGKTTAAAARNATGLNVESFTTGPDGSYSILSTDRVIALATFTAPRSYALPAANTCNPGQRLRILDGRGTLSSTNTLTIARSGSDTINGLTSSLVLATQFAGVTLETDGVSNWYYATSLSLIPTVASAALITSAGGTASFSTTLPTAVQANITQVGTITSGTWNGTGIANANLGAMTNLTIKANMSGGTATPLDLSLSSIVDASISSTRGSLLFRGVSGWTGLAPGTSGFVLTSSGAGTDPSWAVGGGGSGSVTSFNGRVGAITSIEADFDAFYVSYSTAQTLTAGQKIQALKNIGTDQRTAVGDANYSVLSTDRYVVTSAALTTPRTWTLPIGSTCSPGQTVVIADEVGGVTGVNTLIISRNATNSDTINGLTTITIAAPYGSVSLKCDGGNPAKWVATPLGTYGNATLASAATTDLGSVIAPTITVTGTTGITSFGSSAPVGAVKDVKFSGALLLTHNATSQIMPGAQNRTTVAGDCLRAAHEGSGNWRIESYTDVAGWTTYTPTITAGSGTITTSSGSGRYRLVGKHCTVGFTLSITTNGTGGTSVNFTLPFQAGSGSYAGAGRDPNVSGKTFTVTTGSGATTGVCFQYDNAYPGASGAGLSGTLVYEIV